MRRARQYVISGRVQGVGFRWFTAESAAREGLHGWVRNTPDGSVEIRAEGEAESLERFERAISHGPSRARVDRIDVADLDADGRHTGFTVAP